MRLCCWESTGGLGGWNIDIVNKTTSAVVLWQASEFQNHPEAADDRLGESGLSRNNASFSSLLTKSLRGPPNTLFLQKVLITWWPQHHIVVALVLGLHILEN